MKKLYAREDYLKKIRGFYTSDLIKVITGIRRCGKSCFMETIIQELLLNGVQQQNIIHINLDKKGFQKISTPDQLEQVIDKQIKKCISNKMIYLFIDEIQNVKNFEPLINAYREEGNFSIFVTGSNSYLLSGELITKLTGRYIELEIFPLTFKEYIEMKKFYHKSICDDLDDEFLEYIRFGGFPKTIEFDTPEDKQSYTQEVLQQIFKKDIHKKIRNWSIFEKVVTYFINNFGSTTNLNSIAEYLKDVEHISIKSETIFKYLQILENSKIIYRCNRFDLKSKKSLKNEQKYYLADLSIFFSQSVDNRINFGPVLENILFTYLSSKGYKLSIGKIGKLECDFITRKNLDYQYIQIAMTIADPKTEDREYTPFLNIRDNYPKYLFTMDHLIQHRDGVIHKNIIKFIKENENL